MSSPMGLRARRDSLTSISTSSQVDKAQLAQALDKIHTSASQSDALTTFNDFAPPPGSAPPAESKGTAGDLVQAGLSGLYSRLKEAVGVVGKTPAQEPGEPGSPDPTSKRSSVMNTGNNVAKQSSAASLPRGDSGGTSSTFGSSTASDALHATSSSSGAITNDSHSQAPRSSKASSITTMTASKSTSSSGQNLPKMAKAVVSSVANPSLAPITVSAFKDKDAARGVTTRVEEGPLSARGRGIGKTSEDPGTLLPGTTHSQESLDVRLPPHPSRARREDGASIDGGSDAPLSPVKGSAASISTQHSGDTSIRSMRPSVQGTRLASRETLKKPAVIDRISRSRTPGDSRSRSSSMEPGMAEPSPISTSAHNSVYHDSFAQHEKPEHLPSGKLRIPGTTANEGATQTVSARLESMRKQVVSKEFWMADETCKECFLCGQPFSAFRRKHHCRTCGCIFDSKCTSTISGQKFGVPGTLRVCKTCLDIINRRYDSGSDDSGDDSYLPAIFRSGLKATPASRSRADDETSIYERMEDGGENSRSTTTPMMAIPATRRIGDSKILEIDAPQLSRPSSSRSLKSLAGRPLSSGHRRTNSKPHFLGRFRSPAEDRAPFRKAVGEELGRNSKLPAFHDDNIIDPELEPYMSEESSGDEQMSIFATMASSDIMPSSLDPDKSNFGPFLSAGKRHRMRPGEKSISGLSFTSRGLDDSAGPVTSMISHSRPARRRNLSTTSASQHHVMRSPRPRSGVYPKGFSASGELLANFESTNAPVVEATKLTRSDSIRQAARPPEVQLSPSSLKHVRKLLRQLLQDAQVPNVSAWDKALIPILLRCADDVAPDIRRGDSMDIRTYVKLKKIPGSKPGDTSYVSGLIFTKNLALKSMPRSILNPRIIIISFPIEYQRQQHHFMSLQPVIEQEKEFLRVVVNRIIALRPQVLLAEKSVAGVALQYLSEANIAVAYNVKSSMVDAVSRFSGAEIISSLDMLALPNRVGAAGGFEVKTFVNKEVPGRKKTYIFISGCERDLGCTIALRGAPTPVLTSVKRITEFMVYVVYNLKLESCLMRDEYIKLPDEVDGAASVSLPSTSREPTDESLLSMGSASVEAAADNPPVLITHPSNEGDSQRTHSSEESAPDLAPTSSSAAQPSASDPDTGLNLNTQMPLNTSEPGVEPPPPPSPQQQQQLLPTTARLVSMHASHSRASHESPVPEDVPMPTFYSDMVAKYETKILSASPFVKFTQPYLLMKAREQERRLVYLKQLRDQDLVEEHRENEKPKPDRFQLIKPEMVHEIGQKAPRQIMEVLHAVHDAEYDKALYNYKTQTRHWENYIQGNLDLFDPYSHQNIVVLYSVICTETKIPCTEPGLIAIGFYDDEPNEGRLMDADWRLGHYVENICMGAYDMCHANGCDRPMWQHHRTYVHEEARITMFIEKDSPLPGTMQVEEDNNDIYMWNYCKMCNKDLGLQAMSESTWKYSFGKYLELSFWGKGLQLHPASDCPHDHQLDHIKYFNFRGTSIRIHYDPIDLLEIIVPRARITWKVDHDLGLKNEIFTKSEERWNRFMSSVRARLKSIRIDSVLPEKSESCKAEVERLTKKAQEDQPELIRKLQGAYMGSKYYEVIPMNPIIREMLERVSEWDAAFAKFEADFLSDKDVRQLTLIQLKKMFGDNESKESLPSTDGTGTGTGTGTSIISTAGSETDERTVATTQTSISEDLDEKHISTSQPSDAAASVTGGTVPPSLVGDQAASLDLDGSVNRGSDNNNNNNNLCNKSQVADAVLDAVEPLDLATSPRSPLSAKSKPLFPPDHGPGMTGSRIPGAPTALSESSTAPASGAAHDTDTGSGVAPSQPVPSQQGQQGQQGQQIQQGQQHLQNQIIPGPSLPPPKSAPSLTEKVEQMRREFRTLSGETSQIVAALEAQAEQQQQQQKSALPVQVLVPERGSSRRAGLNVSPPIVRAISQPAVPFARSQSSLGKQPPPGKDGRPADSGPAGDLTRTSAEGSGTVKSEKKLSDRLGLGALKSHRKAGQSSIPRYVHGKKKESKVSALAKHFEQLSREFERERMRDRKQRAAKMHYSRAFLPRTSTKATVEVYEDVDQAVQELNHEDDHLLERDQEQEQGQGQEQGQERASNSSNKDATIEAAETATEPPAARIIKSSDRLERPTSPVTTSPAEIPSQPDELSTEGEGEGEGEADDDNKHDGSRGASDDEGASDGDQSSLLEDMLHIPESLEPSGEIPKYQKSSLMKMLTNFWAERSASGWPQLEYPVNATDHIFIDSDVIVREDEPSSLIAFALSSTDYQAKVADIRHSWKMAARGAAVAMDEADGADGTDGMDIDGTDGMDIDGTDGGDGGESGGGEGTGMSSAVSDMSTADVLFADEEELEKSLLRSTGTHLKYQFTEGSARMLCKIFYAEQFDALRRKCGVADRIVESLSRCLKWDSRGGKTKSVFLKTLDDRLVMKSLSPIETAAFLRFAPAYFNIMAEALFHDLPSVIAKMLGFFQVIIKNPVTNTEIKLDLLVMENLFYDRSPDRIFDLKGSMRNRKIQSTGEQNEVLLDENMVEYIYESPLFAREHSKKILRASVWNDTLFLARQNVMDYSLMVAVDEAKKELVVGIIDCIRTYTWDKKLESWIKDRGFAGGGRNRPTVTSPKEYKSRFREAMARYILQAPNCWHQFGSPSSSTPVVARTRFEELPPRGE